MPSEKLLDSLDPEDLANDRGRIHALRKTSGTKRWERLLGNQRVPEMGKRQVVVTTGRENRDLNDLGAMVPFDLENGKCLFAIVLDDPHPKEVETATDPFKDYIGKTFKSRFLRECWDALMVHIYLHELGHAWHCSRNGWGGGDVKHEVAAERYAWRLMQKLHDKETVLGALALIWMTTSDEY